MHMFDLERLKRKSGLSSRDLACLEKRIREEFRDEMMFELHFVRVLKALQAGWITREEVLAEGIEVEG